jgi:Uma2 family endonuclease
MAQFAHHVFSFADYVLIEADSTIRHEFLQGRVSAMAGGSPRHAAIAARVISQLITQLRGHPCEVFTSDLRIRVLDTGLGTYPDGSVVCGSLRLDPEDPKGHTVTNPKLVVEVLSPSTEEYDRTEKREHYQTIASLEEIVLVAHDQRRIDVWRREGARWALHTMTESGSAELRSVGCRLDLGEVYRDPLAS